MMDIYKIQCTYQSMYLVMMNGNTFVSVCKYEKCKVDRPFLSFQAKIFLLVHQRFVQ